MDYTPMGRYPSSPITIPHIVEVIQHCAAVCEYTENAILSGAEVQSRRKQLKLLRDCADICAETAKYISRHSKFSKKLALLCAKICEKCGHHCLMHPDAISQHCGRICLHCAKECRVYAGSHHHEYYDNPYHRRRRRNPDCLESSSSYHLCENTPLDNSSN